MQLRHIVVAADESEAGRSAARAGLDLAARASTRLTVMRVVPADAERGGPGNALARLEQWLEPDLARHPGVKVELGIALGLPGIEICRYAEQRGADLLVLGRKRRSALARLLVGDTADAVIRRSRVPCLFVEQERLPLTRLLAALDGTERGMRVFATARDFVEAVCASLSVVTVEDLGGPQPQDSVPPLPLTRSSRLWRELEPPAQRHGAPAATETMVAIRQGRVVPEVIAEVAASDADVLAFGCHRGGPSGILETGSTARHLAHTAPVSVLTIPL